MNDVHNIEKRVGHQMDYKITGLGSILLVFVALGIASSQLFQASVIFGFVYLVCIPIAFLNVSYHYCRKCPHVANDTCRHVVLGWAVKKLFKYNLSSKYTFKDLIFAAVPLGILVILPQYWLFVNMPLFVVFWVLMLIAVMIVRTGVCVTCQNTKCSFCPNKEV